MLLWGDVLVSSFSYRRTAWISLHPPPKKEKEKKRKKIAPGGNGRDEGRYIRQERSTGTYIKRPPKTGRDQRHEQWLSQVVKHTANVPLTWYVAIWMSVMVV
jgi:hypothetical protein